MVCLPFSHSSLTTSAIADVGTIYDAKRVASNTLCIVTIGEAEAKISTITDEYLSLSASVDLAGGEKVTKGSLYFGEDEDEDAVEKSEGKESRKRSREVRGEIRPHLHLVPGWFTSPVAKLRSNTARYWRNQTADGCSSVLCEKGKRSRQERNRTRKQESGSEEESRGKKVGMYCSKQSGSICSRSLWRFLFFQGQLILCFFLFPLPPSLSLTNAELVHEIAWQTKTHREEVTTSFSSEAILCHKDIHRTYRSN